jgi:hypothetical protein
MIYGKPFYKRVDTGNLEISRHPVMGLQLCSGSSHDQIILAPVILLNQYVISLWNRLTEIQGNIGIASIKLCKEVIKENLHIKCLLSTVGKDGRYALDIASNTWLNKTGSCCCRYNLLLGYSIVVGLKSKPPIVLEPMSSVLCSKYTLGVTHNAECCPQNDDALAKGMEACGAARIVGRTFQGEDEKCSFTHLVTNDDASVRKGTRMMKADHGTQAGKRHQTPDF